MGYTDKSKEELSNELQELQNKYNSLQASIKAVGHEPNTTEIRLRESEARYSTIFRSHSVGIGISRISDNKYIEVNDAFLEIFGYTYDEVIGHTSLELGLWPINEERTELYEIVSKQGKLNYFEASFRKKTGEIGYLQISAEILMLNNEPHLMGTLVDITENKRNEAKFRETQQRLVSLFESSSNPIFVVRVKTKQLVEANLAACQLYGYTKDEILQLKTPDISAEPELTNQAIEDSSSHISLRYHKKKDGTLFPVEISGGYFEMNNERFHTAIIHDLTEIKSTLEAIQISEENLKKVFQAIPDGLGISRLSDAMIIDVNTQWEQIFGYTRQEAIGKTSFEINAYKDPDERDRLVALLKEDCYIRDYEIEMIAKSGEVKSIALSTQLIFYNHEKCIITVAHDLTEKKKTEAILSASEKRFRNLFDNMKEGFAYCKMIYDGDQPTDFIYIAVNDAFEKLTGLKNVNGKYVSQVIPGIRETDKELLEIYGRVALTEISEKFEIYMKTLDMWFSISVYSPEKEYFVAVFDVITERKKTEAALRESRLRYKATVDQSSEGITITNLDGQYIMVNPAFCSMTGYTEDELLSMHITNLRPKDAPLELFAQISEFNQPGNRELELVRKDGSTFYALIAVSSLEIDNKRYLQGIVRDITDRKAIENELIKAKEKAEESDRLKTAFLQNMSHEIRTPMNAIMGFSQLLVKNYNNKPKIEKFSEIIIQRSSDLLEIINDILDISKIESGQLTVSYDVCDLDSLFKELTVFFNEYQQRIGKQHIHLNLNASSKLSENTIVTDIVKLKQIFINLISNAFKFTENGKIEGGYRLDKDQGFIFNISDTGIGIPADKYSVIFERFTQLNHYTKRPTGGTGLGLPIVKGLLGLLGGKIWLESTLHKGTTFYFSIPYKIARSDMETAALPEENRAYNLSGKTILIVEDDPFNTTFIKEIISETEVMILHTAFGNEAMRISANQSVDLILMDIRLPDINGYEVIRHIKQHKPDLKIIAQTAYATDEDKEKAFEAGCVDYISKPLKNNLLLSMIYKHLKETKN